MCLFVDALEWVTEVLLLSKFIDRVFPFVTLHFILFIIVCVCDRGRACHGMSVEARGQFWDLVLPLMGSGN